MIKFGVKLKAVIRCKDEFLIVNKWYNDNIENHYHWEFLDMDLMPETSAEEQCLNYIYECTGIHASIDSIPYTWTYRLGDNNCLGIVFLCDADDQVVFMGEDIVDYKWVKSKDLSKYITKKMVLEDFKKAGVI